MGRNYALDLYSQYQERYISNHEVPHIRDNLTKEEEVALTTLKCDSSMVIGNADKVGGIVIWNADDYIKECLRHLEDNTVYTELKEENCREIHTNHSQLVNSLNLQK